jgi:hypothetical protein
MLTLTMRLSQIQSSQGILKTVVLPTAGTWYEKLGEWESALQIDEESHDRDTGSLLRCYAKLERWEEIRHLVKVYDSMSSEEKTQNSLCFAWAFYRANDLEKVSSFVNRFSEGAMDHMALKAIFLVAGEQYEMTANYLEHSRRHLAKDCSIYSALNANQADKNLVFSQNRIELAEALAIRRQHGTTIPQNWIRRLNSLSGASYSWMRVVKIRNLAFTLSEKHDFLS